jgi:hypothetical protein
VAKFYVLQIKFRENEKSNIFVSAHVTKGLNIFTGNFCAIFKLVFAGLFYLVVSPVPPLTRLVSCPDRSEMSEKQDLCKQGVAIMSIFGWYFFVGFKNSTCFHHGL